jgi:hypothetical protein
VIKTGVLAAALILVAGPICAQPAPAPLKEGESVELSSGKGTLKQLDSLPFIESDYTKRFKFDSFSNPRLWELRNKYKLDEVVAPGKVEFEKQVLLMHWAHRQFRSFGHPSTNVQGALGILNAIQQGHTFFCSQYAQLFVSAAASLGWVDRPLALRRHQGVAKGGSSEHTSTEIWSNQYGKWVMLDPTSNMYLEKEGKPLNAYEIRQEWFYHDGHDLTFVIANKRYKKAELPVFLQRFAGFGNLTVDPDELDKYGFTAYIPNTDLMDSGFDYGKMFIVKDKLCDGTLWHERIVPSNPAVDPYFPIDQAALTLAADGKEITAQLKTLTPNFKEYQVRVDNGHWKPSQDKFAWPTHSGMNHLEARIANQFGITGPISTAELAVWN